MAPHGYAALRMSKRQHRGAGVAALLSGLLPGLGQAWLGARRRGLLIALPIALGLLVLVLALLISPFTVLDAILRPGALGGVLVAIVVIGLYHLAAIGDAFRLGMRLGRTDAAEEDATIRAPGANARTIAGDQPPRRRRGRGAPLLVVALLAVTAFYGTIELRSEERRVGKECRL